MATRTAVTDRPEQLSLLAPSELPVQFRLDRRTRERGLAHVAELRRLLAANASRRAASPDQRAA
jgi:hypothetical protein